MQHKQYFHKELPAALDLEVSKHLFSDTVGGVALFEACSEAFLREVVLKLSPQVCIPGEYIVNKGDVAKQGGPLRKDAFFLPHAVGWRWG